MLISLEQWKAFRFKNESAFRGNDQYSQGVRDTLRLWISSWQRAGRLFPIALKLKACFIKSYLKIVAKCVLCLRHTK